MVKLKLTQIVEKTIEVEEMSLYKQIYFDINKKNVIAVYYTLTKKDNFFTEVAKYNDVFEVEYIKIKVYKDSDGIFFVHMCDYSPDVGILMEKHYINFETGKVNFVIDIHGEKIYS